jgi:hypothetical protein
MDHKQPRKCLENKAKQCELTKNNMKNDLLGTEKW